MTVCKSKIGKWTLIIIVFVIVGSLATYAYIQAAFPEVRCEAKHLTDPSQMAGDCYGCHITATAKIAQDWYESKHGVLLVKCFVCHGSPDGKGAVPFAADPDPQIVCGSCHAPAIKRMEEKYGLRPDCNSCHPVHQNSIHHDAYQKTESQTTIN